METYKFRIYPNKNLIQRLEWELDTHRKLYNYLLGYYRFSRNWNRSKQIKPSTQWMVNFFLHLNPEWRKCYYASLQYENWKIQRQVKSLSSNKKCGRAIGLLRFKQFGCYDSFSYCGGGFKIINKNKKYSLLKISKIGIMPIRIHREIKPMLKHLTIKREGNKWFAILISDFNNTIKDNNREIVGIDLGIKSFIVDSEGNSFEHPKTLLHYEKILTKKQRELSKKKKGSNNRLRTKNELKEIHLKIVRKRDDFLHKTSNYYASKYKYVCAEDLRIAEMMKDSAMNMRNIADASWGKFLQMLEYKLKKGGGLLILVNPKDTTKTCSACGNIQNMPLRIREYKCIQCGFESDRDLNAAKNILRRGKENIEEYINKNQEKELKLKEKYKSFKDRLHKKKEDKCSERAIAESL